MMPMNERMQENDEAIAEEVRNEMNQHQQQAESQQRRLRAVQGDQAVGDGTFLFHGRRRPGSQAPNLGDNSRVSREGYVNSLQQMTSSLTPCPIRGCQFGHLKPTHKCHNTGQCKAQVHNLCAQASNLLSEENELHMHCSKTKEFTDRVALVVVVNTLGQKLGIVSPLMQIGVSLLSTTMMHLMCTDKMANHKPQYSQKLSTKTNN